jgi:hypothetical protein
MTDTILRIATRVHRLAHSQLRGPRGPAGPAGPTGGNLSDAPPAPLGTVAPGVSTEASRADHVHPIPSLTVADVTGAVGTTDPRLSDARTPTAHAHVAADISDSTATGRALVKAVSGTAACAAIGALPLSGGVMTGAIQAMDTTSGLTGDILRGGPMTNYPEIPWDRNLGITIGPPPAPGGGECEITIHTTMLRLASSRSEPGAAWYENGGGGTWHCAVMPTADNTQFCGASWARWKSVYTYQVELTGTTVAGLPATAPAGTVRYVTNGRNGSEGAGTGTGCLVVRKGSAWYRVPLTDVVTA